MRRHLRRLAFMRRLTLTLAVVALAALAAAGAALAQTADAAPNAVSNLALWSLIVAAAVPAVVGIVKQSHWSALVKTGVMFVVSCAAAAGTAYWKSELTGRTWLESLLLILAAGIAYYEGIYKSSGVDRWLDERTQFGKKAGG